MDAAIAFQEGADPALERTLTMADNGVRFRVCGAKDGVSCTSPIAAPVEWPPRVPGGAVQA